MSLSALPLASTLVHVQVEPYSHDALAIWPVRTQISFVQKQLWSLDAALPKGAAVVAIPHCPPTLLLKLWWTPCNTEWLSTVCLGIWVRLCPLWKYQEMFNIFTLLYIFHYCFWLVQYKILQHNFRVVALAISVFLTVLCSYTILWSSKVQRP